MTTQLSKKYRGDAIYALGHSERERRRLIEQDAFLGGFTRRLLLEAGIGPGMCVLDIGCGVGDVSLLVASLVGPKGGVVGVDTDPLAIADARGRVQELGLQNVHFIEGDLRDLTSERPFDAAVGRFVLMYLADPVEALRRVAEHVRPGGVFALQEWMLTDPFLSYPHSPLWQRTSDIGLETVRRAGSLMEIGLGLYSAFVKAGLPAPSTRAERPTGGGPAYPGYRYLAGLIRSMLPVTEQLGVATAEEVGVETLAERLRDEVAGLGGAVSFPSLVGAWTQKPAETARDHKSRDETEAHE